VEGCLARARYEEVADQRGFHGRQVERTLLADGAHVRVPERTRRDLVGTEVAVGRRGQRLARGERGQVDGQGGDVRAVGRGAIEARHVDVVRVAETAGVLAEGARVADALRTRRRVERGDVDPGGELDAEVG